MNKFASTIVNHNNLDEIHDKYWNKVRYILHPNIYVMKYCQGMIGVWMKNHFVSSEDFSIFGFMHEFGTNPTVDMTDIRSQNYTNMAYGQHGIQTLKVTITMLLLLQLQWLYLLFDVFILSCAHPIVKSGQAICPNMDDLNVGQVTEIATPQFYIAHIFIKQGLTNTLVSVTLVHGRFNNQYGERFGK